MMSRMARVCRWRAWRCCRCTTSTSLPASPCGITRAMSTTARYIQLHTLQQRTASHLLQQRAPPSKQCAWQRSPRPRSLCTEGRGIAICLRRQGCGSHRHQRPHRPKHAQAPRADSPVPRIPRTSSSQTWEQLVELHLFLRRRALGLPSPNGNLWRCGLSFHNYDIWRSSSSRPCRLCHLCHPYI